MFAGTWLRGGFNLGVDFQPGVSVTVQIAADKAKADIEQVRKALAGQESLQVQVSGDPAVQQFILRVRQFKEATNYAAEISRELNTKLDAAFGAGATTILGSNSVGPRFSQSLTQQAFLLVSIALVLISIYIVIRFRLGYAIGAMVATIHDTVFMIAFIGVTQMEITSATIAAILTIIGYSLNDTIVVFDRIRENEKTMAEHKLSYIIDRSVTDTLSRTIMTSFTTLIAVVAIAIFTTGEIKDFAMALIVGIVVGTYSSIFIASPVLLEWRAGESRRRRGRAAIGSVAGAEKLSSDEETPNDPTEVDADAIADQLRKQRQDRKKF